MALGELLTGCSHRHHVGLDVVQLLLKLQLEQDGLKPHLQLLHGGHLARVERTGSGDEMLSEYGQVCVVGILKGIFFLFITHFVELNKAACVWFNSATIFCVQPIFATVSASSIPMLSYLTNFSPALVISFTQVS